MPAAAVGVVIALGGCVGGAAQSGQNGPDGQSGGPWQSGAMGAVQTLGSSVAFEPVSLADAPEAGNVVRATRDLGLTILSADPEATLVTSPASAVIALAMLGAGSTGETNEQMSQVLGASGEERDEAVNALSGSLDPYRAPAADIDVDNLEEEPQIHLANQLVLTDGFEVEGAYLDALKKWYDADLLVTDLASPAGKEVLDAWVKENTAGLIEHSAMEPSGDLRAILQNATVFASKWQAPFLPDNTASGPFTTGSGEKVTVDFLHDSRLASYSQMGDWKLLELPYGSEGNLVARFVLPPAGTNPTSVTPGELAALETSLADSLVTISVPKLDLKSTSELKSALTDAGLTSVFADTPPALEYIAANMGLYVSDVVQQGRLRMDEDGTAAAAVTEIMMNTSALVGEEVDFTADHPYLVFIQDKTVGWDLFQVLVNDPKAN